MKVADLKKKPPKIILYGPPGTGKTALVMTLGSRLRLYDLDDGARTGLTFKDAFRDERLKVDIKQCIDEDSRKPVGYPKLKSYLIGCAEECRRGTFPFEYICVDSLTTFADAALRQVLSNAGRLDDNRRQIQDWGMSFTDIENVLAILKALPIGVIMIAHDFETVKEESTKSHIAVPGKQLPHKLPAFFDELWYAQIRSLSGGEKDYCIRTKGTADFEARTRCNLEDRTSMKEGMVEILRKCGYDVAK